VSDRTPTAPTTPGTSDNADLSDDVSAIAYPIKTHMTTSWRRRKLPGVSDDGAKSDSADNADSADSAGNESLLAAKEHSAAQPQPKIYTEDREERKEVLPEGEATSVKSSRKNRNLSLCSAEIAKRIGEDLLVCLCGLCVPLRLFSVIVCFAIGVSENSRRY
jgi:hypothetical protein